VGLSICQNIEILAFSETFTSKDFPHKNFFNVLTCPEAKKNGTEKRLKSLSVLYSAVRIALYN
jgi:hypothetical protein